LRKGPDLTLAAPMQGLAARTAPVAGGGTY